VSEEKWYSGRMSKRLKGRSGCPELKEASRNRTKTVGLKRKSSGTSRALGEGEDAPWCRKRRVKTLFTVPLPWGIPPGPQGRTKGEGRKLPYSQFTSRKKHKIFRIAKGFRLKTYGGEKTKDQKTGETEPLHPPGEVWRKNGEITTRFTTNPRGPPFQPQSGKTGEFEGGGNHFYQKGKKTQSWVARSC